MTAEEKTTILDLRSSGHGYKKIAFLVELPENTVKSFLRRNPVACVKDSGEDVQDGQSGSAEAEPAVTQSVTDEHRANEEAEPPVTQSVTDDHSATVEAVPAVEDVTDNHSASAEAESPVTQPLPIVDEEIATEETSENQNLPTPPASIPCQYCGTLVPQTPGRKEKKFCSVTCRTQWWNQNKYKIPRKTIHTYFCPSCGREFLAYGTTKRKYCSHACYIAGRFHNTMVD